MKLKMMSVKTMPVKHSDCATILGDGWSLPEDLQMVKEPGDIFSIGRSYNYYSGIVHNWVNVDGTDSKWWAENLPRCNNGKLPIRHSIGDFPWYDVDWEPVDEIKLTPDTVWHGSSSLFAAYICLSLGYDRVVLAGCPLDDKGHWWAKEHTISWPKENYTVWEAFAKTPEAKRVTSLSGITREILARE